MTFNIPKLLCMNTAALITIGILLSIPDAPANAALLGRSALLKQHVTDSSVVVPVVVVRRGRAVIGPRGGAVVRRSTVVRPGYRRGYRPGYVRPGVRSARWVRPGWYRWPPGGAIAAGAAIGVVTAATAAAWAGAPPAPGYCWYYTDPSQRQGFWDVCR
ncbi:MAG: hypothetical protein ABI150_05490 [Nitrobacter sp.]